MRISSVSSIKERTRADVIIVPVWSDQKKPKIDPEAKGFETLLQFPLEKGDFLGKEGETLLLYHPEGKEPRVLVLGLGDFKTALPDGLRRSYALAVKALRAKGLKKVNILFPQNPLMAREIICRAVMEGVMLSNYAFNSLKHDVLKESAGSELEEICFCGLKKEELPLLKKTEILMAAVKETRDLVNGNADEVNVDALCHFAKQLEKKSAALKVTILDKKRLEKEKMGLMLAVGRGAATDPALVILEYKGDPKSKERIAFVGKGITYDTGGLNLKPTGSMETMKCDMAGAACVLGVMQALTQLKIKKNVIGVLAIAENAIGPLSYKPGDVYISRSGKTVEIANTDAEGRLVLADALSYVQETYKPSQVIDIATLTGGIVIALGEEATGLFCNNERLAELLKKAGERTHERVWQLPIYPEYKEMLKSSIADIKNSGPRKASSATAAIFLEQFIKQIPWAHLDIAGTGYLSELKPYHPTPATGVGVRLLIDFLENLSQ